MPDLVRVTTGDGVKLDGALHLPEQPGRGKLPVDAVLLVHGTGSNFYASSLIGQLASWATSQGIAALSVNTRGHDLAYQTFTLAGPRWLGAAFEVVQDGRYDLPAWVQFLAQRGFQNVVLMGHSLGAIKGTCWLAAQGRSAEAHGDTSGEALLPLIGFVGLSPARLSYRWFLESPQADLFQATLTRAQELVQAGQAEQIIQVEFPLPYLVTARGYLDKYGPGEQYNVLEHLRQVALPTLLTWGSEEVSHNIAFRGLPDAAEEIGNPRVRVEVIAGGDHNYSAVRPELTSRLRRWMQSLA